MFLKIVAVRRFVFRLLCFLEESIVWFCLFCFFQRLSFSLVVFMHLFSFYSEAKKMLLVNYQYAAAVPKTCRTSYKLNFTGTDTFGF